MIPGRGQAALQLLKQDAAVLHLLDHLKALGDDPVSLAVGVEPLHGGAHLVLQPRDAAQPLEVIHHIQNQRRFGAAGGQRPADLLLINDGRHGGPEQDHARDALDMDALVQHIDAEQQLQSVAPVRLEGGKFPAGVRVAGIGGVGLDLRIDPCEPLRHVGEHFVHVFFAGTEHDVLSTLFCDMMGENPVEAVGLFQRAAQRIEVFLVCVLHAGAAQGIHPRLVFCKLVLVAEHRGHIFRGRQNPPHDGFAQGHFGRDVPVKQFFGHIAIVVEVADVGGGQPQHLGVGTEFEQFPSTCTPAFSPGAVELVHHDIGGLQGGDGGQLLRRAEHQFGVGEKADIRKREIRLLPPQALDLRLKDILARRQPKNSRIGVVLDQLESNIALAGAGGVDDGCFSVPGQHGHDGPVSPRVVFVKL